MKKKKSGATYFNKSKSEKTVFTIAFVIFVVYAFTLLYPLIWLLTNSVKHNFQFVEDLSKILSLPRAPYGWHIENYATAFEKLNYNNTDFFGMFFNSIWYCLVSIGINMFVSACTGYILSKYKFKARNFIYATAIICMTLPIFGTGGASYTFYYKTGLYDTPFFVMVTSLGAFGSRFLMLYGFFKSVSWEYAEAVFIDGGGDFTVFFKIMLPLAMPIIMALSITGFIQLWNTYETLIIYMPSYPTIAVGLYEVRESFTNDRPVYFSAMIISIIPVIALFIAFSDVIMNNISIGGLKG